MSEYYKKAFVGLVLVAAIYFAFIFISNGNLGQTINLDTGTVPQNNTPSSPQPSTIKPVIPPTDSLIVREEQPVKNPTTILKLSDITVLENDKRGAMLDIGPLDSNNKLTITDQTGLYIGESITLKGGMTIKLKQVNAGYSLNSEWVSLEINGKRHTVDIGEMLVITTVSGDVGIQLSDILSPADDYTAIVDIIDANDAVIGTKFLSRNQISVISGKNVRVTGIYPGLTLNVKAMQFEVDSKYSVLNVGGETPVGTLKMRLVDIVPTPVASELEKDKYLSISGAYQKAVFPQNRGSRKAIMEIYALNKSLMEYFTLKEGEMKKFDLDSVRLQTYALNYNDGKASSGEFITSGTTYQLRTFDAHVGQIFRFGPYYARLADFSMPEGTTYASFDYIKDGNIEHAQYKIGDKLTLSNGNLAEIVDIAQGFSLSRAYVKVKTDNGIITMLLGEYLCPNLAVSTDISDCANQDYKTKAKVMTEEMEQNTATLK